MVTIEEIAKEAGVSKATVSRVLNSNGYVSAATREKVEAVIKEKRFSPSAAAQHLSRKESNTIGVIVPELDNEFFTEVLAGAAEVIDAQGLTMIVINTNNDEEKEQKALKIMEQERVRGIVFTPANVYSEQEARHLRMLLKHMQIPVVIVDREIDNVQWDGVFYENFQSGYLATEHLIRSGRRHIGIINGNLKLKHGLQRYQGYLQAMSDYNLPVEEKYIYNGNFSQEITYEVTKEMIASGDYPDGLVLSNNLTTIGFIHGMNEMGMAPDDKIHIVGIDHIPILDMVGYKYDCITRDMREMGRASMELLMRRLEQPGGRQEIHIIPCELRLREHV